MEFRSSYWHKIAEDQACHTQVVETTTVQCQRKRLLLCTISGYCKSGKSSSYTVETSTEVLYFNTVFSYVSDIAIF